MAGKVHKLKTDLRAVNQTGLDGLALRALQAGAEWVGPRTLEWDVAGDCQRPIPVEQFGRTEPFRSHYYGRYRHFEAGKVPGVSAANKHRSKARVLRVILHTRCRRCDKCLRIKRNVWAARAMAEIRAAGRTWFGTLTLRPEDHHRHLCEARERYRQQTGSDFDSLPHDQQFNRRAQIAGEHITKYLKRVRKDSGATIRYLLVCEKHKNGLPHFHLLLHEVDGTVLYDCLKRHWEWEYKFQDRELVKLRRRFGWAHWKLVDADDVKPAWYVAKYIGKDAQTRIRASLGYGGGHVKRERWDVGRWQRQRPAVVVTRPLAIVAEEAKRPSEGRREAPDLPRRTSEPGQAERAIANGNHKPGELTYAECTEKRVSYLLSAKPPPAQPGWLSEPWGADPEEPRTEPVPTVATCPF